MSSIELQPSVEQREAWERAAGDQSLSAWLATVADAASGTQPAMTWPHTVALRYPVEFGKETVTSLVFKRGRMEFLKGIKIDDVPPTEQIILLASRLCGQPLKVIESLDPDDASEVIAIALGFIARSLTRGSKRSA
jgi:hypothetical protein